MKSETAAPAADSSRAAKARASSRDKRLSWSERVSIAVLVVPLAMTIAGASYYFAPFAARIRHPLAATLRPSGLIGQGAGVLALLMFLFLWLYPLRKRLLPLHSAGALPRWLDWHIAAGIGAPLFGAVHAGWRFTGLVGLGYGAMALVALSGIVGRYLYKHIPRSLEGVELSREEMTRRRQEAIERISLSTGIDPDLLSHCLTIENAPQRGNGVLSTLFGMLRADLAQRRTVRAFARSLGRDHTEGTQLKEILRSARLTVALDQQARMLDATRRVFQYWHIAHMPVAFAALGAVFVHVYVVVSLGTTWFW
ncbi:MAG: hypothetical protein U0V87_10020 [Acidobacteriota bacterium]